MWNNIPVIGWLVSAALNISLAVPFWICWTACGIGSTFCPFLPLNWQTPGFWQCVGIFICASIVKLFVPTLVSSSSSSNTMDEVDIAIFELKQLI